jgi:hypothetical protein
MATQEQLQFRGQAESRGFAPIVQTSSTGAVQANVEALNSSADRNLAISMNNIDRNYQANVRNIDGAVQALSQFSNTLGDLIERKQKEQNEREMEEGLSMAYTDGVSQEESLAFDIAEGYLRKQDDQVQAIGDQLQAGGGEFMGVQRVRELSGWKQYGYAMGMAQNASYQYPAFIEQTLANLDPEATAADKAAALAQARTIFLKNSGLAGVNPALLNKYAFPNMREADAAMLNRWRKEDINRQQEALVGEAQEILGADPVGNFGKSLDTLVRSGRFNRTTARDALLEMITDSDDIDAIGSSLSWDGTKTWAEKYPLQWAEARRKAIQRENQAYEIDKSQTYLEGKRWFDQVQETWEQEPPSEAEIEAVKRKMSDDFDYVDPRLERWTSRSTDAEAGKYYQQQFEQLDRAGMLTEAAVNAPDVPDEVRRRYLPIAQQQDKARAEVPEFKQFGKQLEADIKAVAQENSLTPGKPGMELAIAKANGDFQRYYMAGIQAGQNPAEAADNAYRRVSADIMKGFGNPGKGVAGQGTFKFNPTEGFTELTKGSFRTGWEKHRAAINAKLKYGGVASLDKFALIPESILKDAVQNSNNPNYTLPAIAHYISDITGGAVGPWAVLDRQARAQGLPGLAPNPRLQSQVQGIRPELSRLLHYRPSYNRVARSYASTGSFNPDRIPRGYGQVVLEAASQFGIDPAILAGVIETESQWNPNAYNKSGATGIAQIIPKWHPTVDPTKPKEAIFYAAKYLNELRAQLGGNMDEAIYAYNSGPGAIRKSAENRAYHPKVMKAAAKYGYNPTGNPWSNPALLNPRVAYVTGNIGPTSTGPHLDVKQVGGGNFGAKDLDRYVEVDDPELGRVPLGRIRVTADQKQHRSRKRPSHGIDYGTASGSRVYLKNGAKVIHKGDSGDGNGDIVIIQLPNGQKYSFLHGRSA